MNIVNPISLRDVTTVRLTNTGSTACSVSGYPSLAITLASGVAYHASSVKYVAPSLLLGSVGFGNGSLTASQFDTAPVGAKQNIAPEGSAYFFVLTSVYPGCSVSDRFPTTWAIGVAGGGTKVLHNMTTAACPGNQVEISSFSTNGSAVPAADFAAVSQTP